MGVCLYNYMYTGLDKGTLSYMCMGISSVISGTWDLISMSSKTQIRNRYKPASKYHNYYSILQVLSHDECDESCVLIWVD